MGSRVLKVTRYTYKDYYLSNQAQTKAWPENNPLIPEAYYFQDNKEYANCNWDGRVPYTSLETIWVAATIIE